MKVLYKILVLCLCFMPMQLCFAKEIVVDINGTGNFTSIQEAIDNAVHGDTLLVLPGTYFENINYNGKNICVISKFGPDTTIIDGSQPRRGPKSSLLRRRRERIRDRTAVHYRQCRRTAKARTRCPDPDAAHVP